MIPHDITDEDVRVAGLVLKAIKQIDYQFKNAEVSNARGWAMIFAPRGYTEQELLGGVLEFYTHAKSGDHAMPGDILRGAKTTRSQLEAADPEYKRALERKRQAKQDQRDAELAEFAAVQQANVEELFASAHTVDPDGHIYDHNILAMPTRDDANTFMTKLEEYKNHV